jgi:uncharacterized protein YoxC
MSKREKQDPTQLEQAAEGVEDELRHFEALADTVLRTPLDSEKNLERASKALREVAESDERLVAQLQKLVAAVGGIRDRQQEHARGVNARAEELQARTQAFQELLQRYAGLGRSAAELNAVVQDIAARRQKATTSEDNRALAGSLDALLERMVQVAEEAQGLATAATGQDFSDIARQADSLRQQLLSARNKMALLQKGLAEG